MKQTISINNDLTIELQYNPLLSNKCYNLRVYGYDGLTEHRLNEEDMLNLAESISDFLFDNPNTTQYEDHFTGIHRLWLQRRNEALDKIEELQNRLAKYES